MQLRKNCNHPDLFTSQFGDSLDYPPVDELVAQCGKLKLLDRLLKHLKDRGHKVLVFSQMTKVLDILEYYLGERGHNPCRIDGSVSQVDRQRQVVGQKGGRVLR
jgi:ATP-dependent DNA helicase